MSKVKWLVIAAILFLFIRFILRPDVTVVFGLSVSPIWYQLVWAVLGTLGIFVCSAIYRNSQRSKELGESYNGLRESFLRQEQELRKELGQLKDSVAKLKFETIKTGGEFRFTKDMPLVEALAMHPDVAKILFSHGLACISCPTAELETIEQAAQVHGFDVQPILDDLNKLLET